MARILVIDDEVEFRRVIEKTLEKKGYETFSAADTVEGWRLATEILPDLIISDVCMEGGDGLSLLGRIRADNRTSGIPFIVMTGQPDFEAMSSVSEFAADGYLPKPFKLSTLLATVARRLERETLLRTRAKEVREQLQRILEASPDLIGIVNPEGFNFHFLNPSGRKLLGLSPQEDVSKIRIDRLQPSDSIDLLQTVAIPKAVEEGVWAGENTLLGPGGRKIPVKQFVQAHRDAFGCVSFLSTIAHDLTEHKNSEAALRESEARFRLLLDSLPDAVLMHDRAGKLLFSNARTEQLFGYSAREMSERSFESFFAENINPPPASRGPASHVESCWRRKDGDEVPVDLVLAELVVNGQETKLSIIRDLSERKRMQREQHEMEIQLRQAQKLESIGQLAAGIAHEINTPTQYIGDNTRFLQDAFANLAKLIPIYEQIARTAVGGPVAPELLRDLETCRAEVDPDYLLGEIPLAIQQSLEGTERVAKIVRAMKDFSHPGVTEKTRANLNELIESTITVARNEWKYVADLETDFDPALPPVPCLPSEFNQVILNLVINAAHAIAEVAGAEGTNKRKIHITTRKKKDFAEIRVADNGAGIPPQIRSKIFEPFFTTKEVGKGTGQGLAICRSVVVDKHGGTIEFESEHGKGTAFIVRLPLHDAPARP